ncbi:MAG: superoxide dismutase [Sphingomonas sp. 28-66-16]|nr:MAG: superoxide dismutase [Sphingomonas sp. 28-66-16]
MRTAIIATGLLATAATIGGCTDPANSVGAQAPQSVAVALLHDANGAEIGRATARPANGGLRVTIDAKGLPPGLHGAHIHTYGKCDAPDFTTAGGHWNPTATQHGSMNPAGPHEGDLPNLVIGADGRGTIGVVIPGATLAGLLDADGSAMVIHAGKDDLMTDPSGNSGGRIACGVFAAS